MTGTELSSLVRHKFPSIIIVLDNGGYGTERYLHPGSFEFNEVQPWAYHKLPEVFGGGKGYLVKTEGEFDAALRSAWADTSGPSLIHVVLDRNDHSRSLERLTEKLSKHV
ncbi:MAG: thiamine pyrophosphate-dependent enzyme [Planctomycetota bacterium]|nr:thiamine pyrophosphate-dependent enzyme [Planctomycetota bacterium]